MNHLLMSWALTAFLPYSAQALQLEMSRGELCQYSDLVVVGEVTSGETRWASNAPEGAIERLRWVHVDDVVRGQASGTLEVVLPGGTMGDLTHWVEDVPELMTNARYLLFLHEIDGGLQIIGGERGAVRIARSETEQGERLDALLEELEVCRAR